MRLWKSVIEFFLSLTKNLHVNLSTKKGLIICIFGDLKNLIICMCLPEELWDNIFGSVHEHGMCKVINHHVFDLASPSHSAHTSCYERQWSCGSIEVMTGRTCSTYQLLPKYDKTCSNKAMSLLPSSREWIWSMPSTILINANDFLLGIHKQEHLSL
jgi:hypothetical protein